MHGNDRRLPKAPAGTGLLNPAMVKTLHLTNAFHESSGGVATFYRALLSAAPDAGCQVRLVVPAAFSRTETPNSWSRIYYVRSPRAPFNGAYRMIHPSSYLLPHGEVRRILQSERPDLVEACDKYTLNYLAGLLRTRRLPGIGFRPATVGLSCERMDANMLAYIGRHKAARWFARRYMKWLYFPMFDHHITVSDYTAEELREAARGHKRSRAVWIRGMGVDAAFFRPSRRSPLVRRQLLWLAAAPDDAVLVLYSGRLVPEKHLPLLLDTLEELARDSKRQYRLLIAGSGILEPSLREESRRRLPGLVTFLGHIASRERLADIYANCDVFLHPNPAEPYGISPLEAMASGLALAAPNSGGLLSYAHRGNAWLACPNARSLAAAVRDASPGAPGREAKLAEARKTAEAHNWPRVVARYFELYRELAGSVHRDDWAPAAPPAFISTPGNWLGMEVQ